jgi:hypothetical protein
VLAQGALSGERNHIERVFGRLKINGAIATRYGQLAESFLGMVQIVAARYWLKFFHAAQANVASLLWFERRLSGSPRSGANGRKGGA